MDDGLARLLRHQDGIITKPQASHYLSDKALRHRIASGRWRRLLVGVYMAQAGAPTLAQLDWVAVLASGGDEDGYVCLGGLSALRACGLRGVEPAAVDVLVPYPGGSRGPVASACTAAGFRNGWPSPAQAVHPRALPTGRSSTRRSGLGANVRHD